VNAGGQGVRYQSPETHLRRDDEAIPFASQDLAQKPLALAGHVDIRGIEERDTALHTMLHESHHVGTRPCPSPRPEVTATEPELGYRQPGFSQRAMLHGYE
jgi:hypothetical protein